MTVVLEAIQTIRIRERDTTKMCHFSAVNTVNCLERKGQINLYCLFFMHLKSVQVLHTRQTKLREFI